MNYNVIGPDGAVYGPVDEATLKQWVTEARILPTTVLEEVGNGRRFEAKTMSALFPPAAPGQPTPQPAPGVLHSGYEPPKTGTTGIGQVGPGGVGATSAAQRMGGTPGYTSATANVPLQNNLVKSIIALLCCCGFPFGIVAVIFAAQVGGKQASGDRIAAQESADKANLFANIGLGIGITSLVIYIIFDILALTVFKGAVQQMQQQQLQQGGFRQQNPFPNGFRPNGVPGGNRGQ